jgi:hypothetical protein
MLTIADGEIDEIHTRAGGTMAAEEIPEKISGNAEKQQNYHEQSEEEHRRRWFLGPCAA